MKSQNFLIDTNIAKRIVEYGEFTKDDTVIEIGAGYGALTKYIIDKVKHLVAVEIDSKLASLLKEKFKNHPNFTLINKDILSFDINSMLIESSLYSPLINGEFRKDNKKLKVIGNIPYHITTPIIFYILSNQRFIESAVLTIQKEVAERIVAKPGSKKYGVLSIMVQFSADAKILSTINPEAFNPTPEVDSAVLFIKLLDEPKIKVNDDKMFKRIVKETFKQRRKMIRNSLLQLTGKKNKDLINKIEDITKINLSKRPEDLYIDEFGEIADAFILLSQK